VDRGQALVYSNNNYNIILKEALRMAIIFTYLVTLTLTSKWLTVRETIPLLITCFTIIIESGSDFIFVFKQIKKGKRIKKRIQV